MKRKLSSILALIMVCVMVGCSAGGSGDTGGSTATQAADTGTSAAQDAGDASTTTEPAAEGKDTIILATSGEPYRFFAQGSQSCGGDDNLVLSNLYDCLLFLEPDGSLTEGLAESYEVSEDGLTYTFHLRQGVTFHNGMPMTAEDVKFTFDTGFQGPIGAALFVNFESCEIIDEYTVEMHLTEPYAAFPYGVASRLGGIACKAYYDEVGEEGYMAAPIGTGPYTFVEYVSGDHTTMAAYEDYWRGAPPIKTVIIQTVTDTNTQILGLQNGDYDIVRNPSIDVCTRLDSDENVEWNSTNSTGRITMSMSEWTGPASDKNFRKAVQAGINKDDINDAAFAGYAETLDIDMCSNYGGYVTVADGIEVVEYDPEKAKEYLAASSYAGEEFAIMVNSGSTLETCAKVIQAQLMEIGINCQVRAVDNPTYQDGWNLRNYEGAYIVNNLSSLVDADGIITGHRTDRWEEGLHYARDPELYDLFMKGRAAQGDARKQFYVEGCNIITEEAYDVPLLNDITTVAYRSELKNVQAHCLGNYNFRLYHY